MKAIIRIFAALTLSILGVSCASSGGPARPAPSALPAVTVNSADTLTLSVTPAASMTPAEVESVRGKILAAVNTRRAAISGTGRKLTVQVALTRYERGSAMARAMLAGLGQIHIDANVTLSSGGRVLSTFPVKKTFAWGGMMGAMTTITEVEGSFAGKVADALTGKR